MESELAFPPDRSRLALFDEARGRLVAMQARGHGAAGAVASRGGSRSPQRLPMPAVMHRPLMPPCRGAPALPSQCGHPLHKLYVSAEQLEQGGAVWDVTQTVELEGLQVCAGELERGVGCRCTCKRAAGMG